MKLLISIIICAVLMYLLSNQIKKHSSIFYILTILLSVSSLWMPTIVLPQWFNTFYTDYILRGNVSTALYILVMYAIVLPKNSNIMKKFMSIRGEMAIIASLLVISHNIYGKKYMISAANITPTIIIASCLSCFMILLLIPLTITSFKCVRKKMKAKSWKRLQRLSYVYYGMLYAHLVLLFVPYALNGNRSYMIDLCIYNVIFGVYLALRTRKYFVKVKKKMGATIAVAIPTIAVLAASILIVFMTNHNTEESFAKEDSSSQYIDGVYTGEGDGFNGIIEVQVTVEDSMITAVSILKSVDDDYFLSSAKAEIINSVIDNQNSNVDTVSGATFSSKGIISAVEDALSKAVAQ